MRTEATLAAICDALQQNCGDLNGAARMAGVSPYFLFQWIKDDPETGAKIQEAQRVGWGDLESAAIQRGRFGVEKAVYYKGEVVGYETQYSDALLAKVMEARIPEYSKKEASSNVFNGPVQINNMPRAENYEQWLEMKAATIAKRDALALENKSGNIVSVDFTEVPDNPMACLEGLL